MTLKLGILTVIAYGAISMSAPCAGAAVVYTNDFSGTVAAEWSSTATDTTPVGARRFLGRFGTSDQVTLSLSGLPAHAAAQLCFDLFVIHSWDGNSLPFGPDVWEVAIDGGPSLLRTTFNNAHPFTVAEGQAYPGTYPGASNAARTGASEVNTLGYTFETSGPMDSVYNLCLPFVHSAETIVLRFSSDLDGPLPDESWGLDNLTLSVTPCGDDILDAGEDCDDGNTINGDGCSAACELETCTAPPSNMIAWWTADETATDLSGNGHHGSLQPGVTYVPGKVAQAFDFDGTTNCVTVPDDPAFALGSGDFTADFWVRFDAAAPTVQIFLGQNQGSNPFWQIHLNPSGQLTFILNPGAGPDIQLFQHPWAPAGSQWYHVAVTRSGVSDPNNWHLYIDGVEVDTDSFAGAVPDVASILTIGCSTVSSINGQLDEVEIIGTALSAAEIQAIYAADTGGTCRPCGDGVMTAGQECDDGNATAGDGCSSTCQIEPCWTCAGEPSVCTSVPEGTTCSDGNACTVGETCMGGFCQAPGGAAPVLGGQLYASGGPVEVEILPSDSGSDSDLYLFEPGPPTFIATNRDTGTVVNLGSFAAGTELVFGIDVEFNGYTFKMGPGSRNPDGMIHAQVETISAGVVRVSFEDIFGFADDYNDNVFEFRGGISPTSCDDSNPCTADACDPQVGCSASPHPLGFPCPNDGEICTSDQCDGAGTCTHPPGNPGTQCRGDAGACDVAEVCDGSSPTCPPDGFESPGAPCGNPADDACRDPDTCDGTGTCQGNHASEGTPCPDDGQVCTADQCDGAGSCNHPAGNAGTQCRPGAGQCDVAEQCNGSTASCPPDGFASNGTSCDDSNACTQTDQCQGGSCTGSNPLVCNDSNPCTMDSCNPGNGACVVTTAPRTDCRGAGKSILAITNRSDDDTLDKFLWLWNLGDATTQAEFGDPTTSASYTLCVYESGNGLLWRADVPPSMTRWKPLGDKGWRYKDKLAMASGIRKMQMKASTEARARVLVKGKGAGLYQPILGNVATPVTAQLHNSDSGLCWEAAYSATKKNTDTQFKAKAP